MKGVFIKLLVVSQLSMIVVSCSQWGISKDTVVLMQQAQQLMEQMPDSALVLLDSINTVSFSDAQKAEYSLLRVQAKDNAGLGLSTDTEIFQAREYLINGKDEEKTALACFYSAKVAAANSHDADKEMKYYQEALDHVRKTDHHLLQGKVLYNMGYLDYDRRWYSDAIGWYKQALKVFKSLDGQYQREIYALNAIGNSFLARQQADSAKFYHSKALNEARLHGDTALQVMVFNNISVVSKVNQQYDAANYFCRQALSLTTNETGKAYIYKNLADIFYQRNMLDSARFYLINAEPLFENINHLEALAGLFYLRYLIEKQVRDYEKSLEYCELFSTYQMRAVDKSDGQALLEIQKKYDSRAKEIEYNKSRGKLWKVIGILACISLFLTIIIYRVQRKNMRQKNTLLKIEHEKYHRELALEKADRMMQEKELALLKIETENREKELALAIAVREKKEKDLVLEKIERERAEQQLALEKAERMMQEKELALEKAEREKEDKENKLRSTEQQAYILQELFNQRDNELKRLFLEKMGIIKKIALLTPYVKANKEKARKAYTQEDNLTQKTHEIVKELQAQNFIDIANEFYPGFTEELKKHCQDLDDRELCTCCLILFEFSNEELDLFINDRFNGTLNTVQHWKSTIRRKLGVPAYGDIKKYLLQNILKETL